MKRFLQCGVGAALAGALAATSAASIIHDDFEFDSSGDYLLARSNLDNTAEFAFDYTAVGIPLAPNSGAGEVGGLRMTANDTLGVTSAITAFHTTALSGDYLMQVDMYIGVTGSAGTTEHAHVGVAGDGVTPNQLFTPITGSGHYVAIDGEGGSSSDYRHFTPSATAVPTGDASYLNDLNTTNASGDTYQNLFPSPPYDFAGSPGNAWTTLQISVSGGIGGTVEYRLTGATGNTPIIRTTAEAVDGLVSLGYADLFTSIAAPFQSQFVIYDNLRVVPEPASALLLALGGLAALRRR